MEPLRPTSLISVSMQHICCPDVHVHIFHVITSCVVPFPNDSTCFHVLIDRGSFRQDIRTCVRMISAISWMNG